MKIQYVIQWYHTNRDKSGNIYSYVIVTDTFTGVTVSSSDVPESNARLIAYHLNGKCHVNNFIFVSIGITKTEYNRSSGAYVDSSSDVIADLLKREIVVSLDKEDERRRSGMK